MTINQIPYWGNSSTTMMGNASPMNYMPTVGAPTMVGAPNQIVVSPGQIAGQWMNRGISAIGNFINDRPYTSAALGIGTGYLMGTMVCPYAGSMVAAGMSGGALNHMKNTFFPPQNTGKY